jgi:hypothetical protein
VRFGFSGQDRKAKFDMAWRAAHVERTAHRQRPRGGFVPEIDGRVRRFCVTVTEASVPKRAQGSTLVQSDMIGFVAFYLVLRIILARVMDVALVVYIHRVHAYDETTDPTGFGIPTHMIADLECPGHHFSHRRATRRSLSHNLHEPSWVSSLS